MSTNCQEATQAHGEPFHGFRGALAQAYATTLPLFLLAFFAAKRLGAQPLLLFMLALLWVAATFVAAAGLAVKDGRRGGGAEPSHDGPRRSSTIATNGDGRPVLWRSAPPTTSARCRPGSTGPRPHTGTTSGPTASTSKT